MRRRNSIGIELTPLLDVILIILFLIITRNSAETERIAEEYEQSEQQHIENEARLEAELENSRQQSADAENIISGYESFDEYSVIIAVGITRRSDGTRTVSVSENGDTSYITYGWDNLRYGENALKAELENMISSAEDRPVFISFNYDENDIYLRDHQLISSVLDDLGGDDLYIKYNTLT
ncbi:MAG: hypothetical protein SOU50_03965 [Oscillospiraceae bacterium]|nr:hypothetical protein [Oscillospiraceae bacterium]MDY2847356.1 hypothetical protein [Oscillospiraceae bacterium]